MNDYQEGLLIIAIATFITFIILSFVKPNKSGAWVSWYARLPQKEKNKYNPSISLNRTKMILVLTSIVSAFGLVLSIYRDEKFTIVTFIAIAIIFIFQIKYTGPKNSLVNDKKEVEELS